MSCVDNSKNQTTNIKIKDSIDLRTVVLSDKNEVLILS